MDLDGGLVAFVFCIPAASSVYLQARRSARTRKSKRASLAGLLQRLINKLPRVEWEKVKDLAAASLPLLPRFHIAVQHFGDLFGNFFYLKRLARCGRVDALFAGGGRVETITPDVISHYQEKVPMHLDGIFLIS